MAAFGMNGRGSELINPVSFHTNLVSISGVVNINGLEGFALSKDPLTAVIGDSTIAIQLRKLFDYCATPCRFSISGGFVIGSKIIHCIIPELCPMVDINHIGISLYNIHPNDYFPPGNNWEAYIGKVPVGKPNPSPRGAGRNAWHADQILCAIGFYARLYEEWQATNGNPGIQAFLKLDISKGTSGIPRILDKALW